MECRAYGICLDSQSRGYLGKDRKVSSAAGGNLSRMHKTEETAKESRLNFMYSHLRNRTLALRILEVSRTHPSVRARPRGIIMTAFSNFFRSNALFQYFFPVFAIAFEYDKSPFESSSL